jgi:hypothetical protein
LHFIHERIGCNKNHAAEVAHARFQEKLHEHRTRVGRTVQSLVVVVDDGVEDEDDTARLSDLIALAEEDEDDTCRLSELIALAEADLQAEEDAFLS